MKAYSLILGAALFEASQAAPHARTDKGVEFFGIYRNDIEVFLGVPYGQDTGGKNRFKPPQPYVFAPGTVFNATQPGYACPQQLGQWNAPLTLLNVTEGSTSENCLNLNIARPRLNSTEWKITPRLPVMIWIHGGSFWVGSNMEPTHQPDALVNKSHQIHYPIIHVAINYRLGIFGFAQSDALKNEGSMNAGLRDQRLAIEWVRDHIHAFGGDKDNITIFGQSSGGLAVGMQILAYGGKKPLPFRSAICQSQALEPGITGNYTSIAMAKVVARVGCNPYDGNIHALEVIDCLRAKDTQSLFDASAAVTVASAATNIGDMWLPVVDGDFLPDAPSKLLDEGRFGSASMMLGWTQDDTTPFTNFSIANSNDTVLFFRDCLAAMPVLVIGTWTPFPSVSNALLEQYPENDFVDPPGTNLSANFYRSATVLRDVLMVCQPLHFAQAMHKKRMDVYLYNWNQTLLEPILDATWKINKLGVVHTSELAYIYNNLSFYNVSGYPFNPGQSDYDLAERASIAWIGFAWTGTSRGPYVQGWHGLQGWLKAFFRETGDSPPPGYPHVFTIGGAN